jgi:uncharacterized protein (DUF1697 family)
MRYVALLRGINVGGNALIKMSDLKACCEGLGLEAVSTFIASGNVLFEADGKWLVEKIEAGLEKRFGLPVKVVLRSAKQMRQVVERAPAGFGKQPAKFRYDAWFVKEPLTAAEVVSHLKPREGVDRVWAGEGVVYASRLIAKASQSRLAKVISSPVYRSITIRNWNTTTQLATLLE